MSQSSAERLKAYLTQLPPRAQALLMREFERALEQGDDATTANVVLCELRKIVRSEDGGGTGRFNDPERLLFRPLEAYLTESHAPGPGQVRRQSLSPIWTWLTRDGAADAARAYINAINEAADPVAAVRTFRLIAADAIAALLAEPDPRRGATRIGPASVVEDLPKVAAVLKGIDALDQFGGKIPNPLRSFGPSQVTATGAALATPALQSPQLLPFALRLVMQRLTPPWHVIRLAIQAAATDDATRVALHPFGLAVPMAIDDLSQIAARLREDVKRGQFGHAGEYVKLVHDGVRGLRTELDIRNDSAWGRSLAMLRVDMSGTLKTEIDNVPGRVRRLLRQRPDKEVSAGTRLDPAEIDETEALIDFVAVCRSFASELAINEVTLRTYADLQSYVEKSTETLVESLRHCEPRGRGFREQQVRAAIRFCKVLFGHDYAVLMGRSADNAMADERKSVRAG